MKDLIKIENLKNTQSCRIIHAKSGLFYNGYDNYYNKDIHSKGKNTLSPTSYKSYLIFNKSDEEILDKAFEGYMITKEDGSKYIRNVIVYSGSEIHKILAEYYDEYDNIPLADFCVERNNRDKL